MNIAQKSCRMATPIRRGRRVQWPESAIDHVNLTRICEFARTHHVLQQGGGDDEVIDRQFNAACRAIWGFTLDDFTDDDLSPTDHAWLDNLTQQEAFDFAVHHGYDLRT